MSGPKTLVVDIETAPITAYVWGLYDQNIGLNQIKKDWHIIAWAAKWLDSPKISYMDNRHSKHIQDDKALVKGLVKLLDEADIVITQNGEKFDFKKINARAVIHKLPPVRPFKSTDILKEGRKVFSFTSHSLEYVSNTLNTKYKKLKHAKYPGFELWSAILSGDKKAWVEMEKYCKHDVFSTEEAYNKIQSWIQTQNLALYSDDCLVTCKCGSDKLTKEGFAFTQVGKYQIYHCKKCGRWPRSNKNMLSKEKRSSLLK